jgi:aminotransferase
MKPLSEITTTVTPSPIRQMFNRAQGMKDVISFTVGEPDFNTPSHIVEAAVEALRRGEHHYTPNAGILPLRAAISKMYLRTHRISYDPATQIIITAGGMEALMLTMMTLLDPGDEVILSDPCWTNYSRQVLICHGVPKFVKVTADSDFQFTADALEQAVTSRTKALIVNSPANPTGGIADLDTLGKIAEIAKRHDLYVISDEVYANLVYEGNQAHSIAALPGMAERTTLINSFSKTYAMTGWRVGCATGPEAIIRNMVKLQENVAACVNSAAQFAAVAALEGTQEPLHEMQRAYAARRKIIVEGFSKIDGLTCFAPQGAFYAFVNIAGSGLNAHDFANDLLEKERVIVVPGEAFGASSDCYIRLSFATSEQTIREGIERISHYMRSLRK